MFPWRQPRGSWDLRGGAHMLRHRLIVFSALLFALAGCAAQGQDTVQSQPPGTHGRSSADGRPVLYDSLGSYSYRITTASPDAQRWFDQGLRLVYAFNHHEAQRAFREAARLDPTCAMCFWGITLTEGGNYNHPTDADREKKALAAVQQAGALGSGARPAERSLIQALAKRHSADPQVKREMLDRAYADAMRDVARQFPDDITHRVGVGPRSEEHTSELQSRGHLVCRLLLEKKNSTMRATMANARGPCTRQSLAVRTARRSDPVRARRTAQGSAASRLDLLPISRRGWP